MSVVFLVDFKQFILLINTNKDGDIHFTSIPQLTKDLNKTIYSFIKQCFFIIFFFPQKSGSYLRLLPHKQPLTLYP